MKYKEISTHNLTMEEQRTSKQELLKMHWNANLGLHNSCRKVSYIMKKLYDESYDHVVYGIVLF